MRKNPMKKSQTMPIHAAFHDNASATVPVANGPMLNPEIQSRSIVTINSRLLLRLDLSRKEGYNIENFEVVLRVAFKFQALEV